MSTRASNEVLLDFFVGPDERRVLRSPVAVSLDELLAAEGGVTQTKMGVDGRVHQTTVVLDVPQVSDSLRPTTHRSRGLGGPETSVSTGGAAAAAAAALAVRGPARAPGGNDGVPRYTTSTDAVPTSRARAVDFLPAPAPPPAAAVERDFTALRSLCVGADPTGRAFAPPALSRFAAASYVDAAGGGLGRMLLHGGCAPFAAVADELYEFCVAGTRWRRLEAKRDPQSGGPGPRHSHAMVVVPDASGGPVAIIMGGVGPRGRLTTPEGEPTQQQRDWALDLFNTRAPGARTTGSKQQAIVAADVVANVADVGVLNDAYELSLQRPAYRRICTTGLPLPYMCCHTATEVGGGRIVVYGGLDDALHVAAPACIHFLDVGGGKPRGYEWRTEFVPGVVPPSRANHTAVGFGDAVVMCGGQGGDGKPLGDLWVLSGAARDAPQWHPVQFSGVSIEPVSGHGAIASAGGRMLVAGGRVYGEATARVMEVQLAPVLDALGRGETHLPPAVCRLVKVHGDAVPRFAFGCAVSAGDDVSMLVYGGAVPRTGSKEGPAPGVHLLSFVKRAPPALGARPRSLGAESDAVGDADGSEKREKPLPPSFLKFIDRIQKSVAATWATSAEEQKRQSLEAREKTDTKIQLTAAEGDKLLRVFNAVIEQFAQCGAQGIPAFVARREERVKHLEEISSDLRKARESVKKSVLKSKPLRLGNIQDLLATVQTHITASMVLNKEWHPAPDQRVWLDAHVAYWAACRERLSEVTSELRGIKQRVVERTLSRIQEAADRAANRREVRDQEEARAARRNAAMTPADYVRREANLKAKQMKAHADAVTARERSVKSRPGADDAQQPVAKKPRRAPAAPAPKYGEKVADVTMPWLPVHRSAHSARFAAVSNRFATLRQQLGAVPGALANPQVAAAIDGYADALGRAEAFPPQDATHVDAPAAFAVVNPLVAAAEALKSATSLIRGDAAASIIAGAAALHKLARAERQIWHLGFLSQRRPDDARVTPPPAPHASARPSSAAAHARVARPATAPTAVLASSHSVRCEPLRQEAPLPPAHGSLAPVFDSRRDLSLSTGATAFTFGAPVAARSVGGVLAPVGAVATSCGPVAAAPALGMQDGPVGTAYSYHQAITPASPQAPLYMASAAPVSDAPVPSDRSVADPTIALAAESGSNAQSAHPSLVRVPSVGTAVSFPFATQGVSSSAAFSAAAPTMMSPPVAHHPWGEARLGPVVGGRDLPLEAQVAFSSGHVTVPFTDSRFDAVAAPSASGFAARSVYAAPGPTTGTEVGFYDLRAVAPGASAGSAASLRTMAGVRSSQPPPPATAQRSVRQEGGPFAHVKTLTPGQRKILEARAGLR